MKKWKSALTVILFLFFFTNLSVAVAHEGEKQESDNYLEDFSSHEHDHLDTEEEVTDLHDSHEIEGSTHESEGSSSHDSHETDATTSNHGSGNHSETTVDKGGHDDSSSHNEEEAHGAFTGKETGPNYIVLSSFASINAGFLLIGIWNKVRKRGNDHGIN